HNSKSPSSRPQHTTFQVLRWLPQRDLTKQERESVARIVPITVSDESEEMSPLWLPSPTLSTHQGDPTIPGTL
ncbi:unnamed protein product, partial [Ilex paraguariensis]